MSAFFEWLVWVNQIFCRLAHRHSLAPRLRPPFRCSQYGPTHLFVACSTALPSFPSLGVRPRPAFLFSPRVGEPGNEANMDRRNLLPWLYTHGGSLIPSPRRKPSHLSWVWGQLESINISHSEIIVARCFIITCKHVKVWIKPHFKVTPSAPPCKVG